MYVFMFWIFRSLSIALALKNIVVVLQMGENDLSARDLRDSAHNFKNPGAGLTELGAL